MSNFDFFLIVVIIIVGVIGILDEVFYKFLKVLILKIIKIINRTKRIITVNFFMKIYTYDDKEFICAKSKKDVKRYYRDELIGKGWKIKRVNSKKRVWWGADRKDYTGAFLEKHECIKGDEEWDLFINVALKEMIKRNNEVHVYAIYTYY